MSMAGAVSAAFQQVGALGGLGAVVGTVVASGVGPTELPQTVAAFHSLVGEFYINYISGLYMVIYFGLCLELKGFISSTRCLEGFIFNPEHES